MKKIYWMRFLKIIFLATCSTIAFTGCSVQKLVGEEVLFFSYNNNTPYSLLIKTYDQNSIKDSITIAPNTKLDLPPLYPWRPNEGNTTLFSPSNTHAEIIFGNKKFIKYINKASTIGFCSKTKKNPYCKSAIGFYDITFQMLNKLEGHAFYIFTFTEEDYRNATPLVFGEGFVGSVWRCTEGAGLQEGLVYNELRFVSESQVEGWGQLEGEPEPELFFSATYSIDGETITITDDTESFTARLNEAFTGLVTNIEGQGECVFFKQ